MAARWAALGGSLAIAAVAVTLAARHRSDRAPSFVPGGPGCVEIPFLRAGARRGEVCAEKAARSGLTVLPLSDAWAPHVLSETPENPQIIRELVVDLANERFPRGAAHANARRDAHFELYGIPPSFSVLGRRLLEDDRHRCHDAVDDTALEGPGEGAAVAAAVQAHLRCDGDLQGRAAPRRMDGATRQALQRFQRRHMVAAHGRVGDETRALLTTDSRELDFRALLRTLRERVADAAGLIEDGTAADGPRPVLGRVLDSEEHRFGFARAAATPVRGRGAPDLIGPATEAAARALGWTSPQAARAFFAAHARKEALASNSASVQVPTPSRFALPELVAVRLPPAPSYHAAHMELRAEIDRGEVWRVPRAANKVSRRPALILYAKTADGDVALMRWPTTIGGWQPFEEEDGSITLRYGESRHGPAVWRDLLAGPSWFPPPGVPTEALLVREGGRLRPNQEIIGPGYRAAYGLLALIHHEERASRRGGEPELVDHMIRTHGSPSYLSIARGASHGCHRLYNHLVLRLGRFLLQHREHVRHGIEKEAFRRELVWEGEEATLRGSQRGYLYELTPPVPVQVLRGEVHGTAAMAARAIPVRGPAP